MFLSRARQVYSKTHAEKTCALGTYLNQDFLCPSAVGN